MRGTWALIPGAIAVLLIGCGENGHRRTVSPVDDDPPARVTDLRFLDFRDSSAVLTWTAPGDDGVVGTVARYDIRLGTAPLTPPTWAGASEIRPPDHPHPAGRAETLRVVVRSPGSDLWVALNAVDDGGNWSGLSNTIRIHPEELRWWDGFSTTSLCCGEVDAITLHEGALVAGGRFRLREDDPWPESVMAQWNGASWATVGEKPLSSIHAFAVDGGDLIAGGWAPYDSVTARPNAFRWDGSAWHPLGNGTGGAIFALATYRDQMIAAGSFGALGDSVAANIASWDGETWRPLGAGLDGIAYVLLVFQDRLIAGGAFTRAGGLDARGLAAWDGSSWQPLGEGIEGLTVRALAVSGGTLFAGGEPERSMEDLGCVAAWDGVGWTRLPGSENFSVNAMADFRGRLVVGGRPTHYWYLYGSICRWDGRTWWSFGEITGTVKALFVDGASLYVGGDFEEAGPRRSPLVARWDD